MSDATHSAPSPSFTEVPPGDSLGRRVALIYYVPAALLGFALFGLGGLIFTVMSVPLYFLVPPSRRTGLGQWIIHNLFRLFVGYLRQTRLAEVDFSAVDALRGAGPLILAPNHPCLMDAVFIMSRLPRLTCVMKAQIQDNPVLGGGARLAGYIRNDSPGGLVTSAVEQLRQGNQLLLFPEGTRTVTPPLNDELKGGFAMIAQRAGAPVQIIGIEASSAFLGKRWSFLKLPYFPLRYRAVLGERLTPLPEESTRDFMGRVRESMLERLRGTLS